jgi:anti-anti-sigma regulatory factor
MGTNELRIERLDQDDDLVVLCVSGRIHADDVSFLEDIILRETGKVALDLKEITLVDRSAVRFLARCEADGVKLRACPAYVREWIASETTKGGNAKGIREL